MNLHAVLVRTEYSGNLGAAARALANMGGDRLILVDPRCELNEESRQMAAGAQEKLRQATIYKTWKDFYAHEGDGMRLAMTRRGGRKRKVFPLAEQLSALPVPETLYVIFGPEADGLDSEDLAYANFACHLPVYGDFASYNLAQAVLISLFMVRNAFPPATMPKQITGDPDPAVKPMYFPDKLIKEWLEAMGFDVQARRSSAYLTLRRLFLQNLPTRHEIQVLEAVLQQNIRKLKLIGFAPEKLADDFSDIARE